MPPFRLAFARDILDRGHARGVSYDFVALFLGHVAVERKVRQAPGPPADCSKCAVDGIRRASEFLEIRRVLFDKQFSKQPSVAPCFKGLKVSQVSAPTMMRLKAWITLELALDLI